MKIYVASSWRNTRQPAVVERLRAEGFPTYDFKNPAPDNHGFSWKQTTDEPKPWSAARTREILSHPVAERGYKFDFDAMQWADACVMVQPCGVSAGEEFGWFAGAGKIAIALLADGQEPELMVKLGTHICITLDEVVEVLRAERGRMEPCRPPPRTIDVETIMYCCADHGPFTVLGGREYEACPSCGMVCAEVSQ